jgi:hypothetical protein
MRLNQKSLLLTSIIFFLLFISYKFSLYHETTQLAYLSNPVISPFQRLFTYLFMMIGIIPTIFVMLYTSMFCHTLNPTGIIQTICFDGPFAMSDSSGFFAYIVACIITTVLFAFFLSVFAMKKTTK